MSNDYREENNNEERDNRKGVRILLILVAVVMIVFGAAYFGYYLYTQYDARQEESKLSSLVQTTAAAEESTVENPIDFPSLQAKNNEIYAWIQVPGTKVDYPIVQSAVNDEFYLKHSAADKSWLASGAIYTELSNTQTFTDRVTLIYGHNGYSDSMFTTLHRFEKQDFFDAHDTFYIYTPEARLTYRIVSAFKYDDRHIMNSFDFQDNEVFREFLSMLQNPDSNNKNVRKDLDKELSINDNIVVLSTCFTNQKSSRYLVCGVLVKNEKTN